MPGKRREVSARKRLPQWHMAHDESAGGGGAGGARGGGVGNHRSEIYPNINPNIL